MREQERYDAERRRPAKKKKSRAERLTVTLLSLLFLAAAGVAVVKYLVRPPEPVENDPPQETGQDGGTEQADGGAEVISNGRERKQYCYTILLSGIDNDAGGSDTNILMRFDAVNKTIDLVSLPRDTLMRNGHKLNYSYAKGGTQMLRDEIAALLGIPVDFSVSVDLKQEERNAVICMLVEPFNRACVLVTG